MSNNNEINPTQKIAPPTGAGHASWHTIRTQIELAKTAEAQRNGSPVYVLQGKKIGEILNSVGAIDDKTLLAIEQHHGAKKIKGKLIGQLLVHMGIIDAETLTRALCVQSGVPMVDVLSLHIPFDILDRIPIGAASEKKVVPVGGYNKALYLAVADPATFSEQHHFAFITKLNIKLVFSPLHEIETYINTQWTRSRSESWTG